MSTPRELIKETVGDLVLANHDGNIEAIAVVTIGRDGNVRTRFAFSDGQKFPLLGASVLLQSALLEAVKGK